MNCIKFFVLILSGCLLGQSKVDEAKLKVFSPDENSAVYNQIYTRNFFFGNFGLKQLINAVPVNRQSVKSIKISATPSDGKTVPVMELYYDRDGKLIQMKVLESFFGKPMTVDYKYRDGLLEVETISKTEKGKAVKEVNQFYYAEGKMIVHDFRDMLDVYSLNGKVLSKRSYMNGGLVLNDSFDGKCRLTTYKGRQINKICFSNLNLDFPLSIDEYTMNEDKNGKLILMKDQTLEIKKNKEQEYSILNNGKEQYILKLNKDMRIQEFNFLGIRAEKVGPVDFKFNYTNY